MLQSDTQMLKRRMHGNRQRVLIAALGHVDVVPQELSEFTAVAQPSALLHRVVRRLLHVRGDVLRGFLDKRVQVLGALVAVEAGSGKLID